MILLLLLLQVRFLIWMDFENLGELTKNLSKTEEKINYGSMHENIEFTIKYKMFSNMALYRDLGQKCL